MTKKKNAADNQDEAVGPSQGTSFEMLQVIRDALDLRMSDDRLRDIQSSVMANWRFYEGMHPSRSLDKDDDPGAYLGILAAVRTADDYEEAKGGYYEDDDETGTKTDSTDTDNSPMTTTTRRGYAAHRLARRDHSRRSTHEDGGKRAHIMS